MNRFRASFLNRNHFKGHYRLCEPKWVLYGRQETDVHAILMGDLVESGKARSMKAVHSAFNQAIDSANELFAAAVASPLTITLGDEFQGLLRSLAQAWDVAFDLRLRLLVANVPCRFVIGMTELETPLNTKQAWNMMGPGLAAARDKLNDKRSGNAYRFSFSGEPIIESLLDAVGDSLTQVELGWTATQLKYYSKVRGSTRTNAEVAKRMGVTPRSLYKVLHAARAEFHQRQSEVLRGALRGLDERYGLAMIVALEIAGYVALLLLLTFGGNTACKWVLRLSATTTPPETGPEITLRAGRVIGVLERLLIFLGLIANSWEILAGVVALKTVARYSKLDEQHKAEYFLIGSLASILWAVVITAVIALYDRGWGFGVLPMFGELFGRKT